MEGYPIESLDNRGEFFALRVRRSAE